MVTPGHNPTTMEASSLISKLMAGQIEAIENQTRVGRGIAGRNWSILLTELEKLEALVRYFDVRDGLQTANTAAPVPEEEAAPTA